LPEGTKLRHTILSE